MVRRESENNRALAKEINYKKIELNKALMSILIFYIYILAAWGMYMILPREHRWTALFYCAVILGAVIFAGLSQNRKKLFYFNIYYCMSFLILFFTLGFRKFSGIDDVTYIQIFNEVSQYGWVAIFSSSKIEPGYLLLNALVSFFTNNYLYMQLLTSFIPLALFYHAFKKCKPMISLPMAIFLLSTMIYFQMISASLVRMFIAISIVFNAYYYIPKKNNKKYILLILIASMFHYSALFMLVLMYFAINKDSFSEKSKRFVTIVFVMTPFVFLVVAKYMAPFMGSRYSKYGAVGDLSFSISSFDTLPLIILLLLFHKKFSGEKADYFKLFISIFALSSIMSFYSNVASLGRLIFYANSAFFLAAPMVSKALNRDSRKIIFYGIIIIYGFFYVYRTQFTLESHIPNLFPYQNIFFTI